MNTKASSLIHKARILSFFTITYNLLEGLISIYFGVQDDSLSLLGFGADSFIEVASAFIVLLKLSSTNPDNALENERKATFSIGVLFLLLSLTVAGTSGYNLFNGHGPQTTRVGLIISVVSLSFMFYLWRAKYRVGFELDSSTVIADAKCSLACIKLSLVLFLGSLIYLLFPTLWWVDSTAALIIALQILREGKELMSESRKEEFKGGCGCH